LSDDDDFEVFDCPGECDGHLALGHDRALNGVGVGEEVFARRKDGKIVDRAVALDVELQFGGCRAAKDAARHDAKGKCWAGWYLGVRGGRDCGSKTRGGHSWRVSGRHGGH
jgi:hypothetical protein